MATSRTDTATHLLGRGVDGVEPFTGAVKFFLLLVPVVDLGLIVGLGLRFSVAFFPKLGHFVTNIDA